jgi:hypothetical protein
MRALEVYQKEELIHFEIVNERLRKLERKKELNERPTGSFMQQLLIPSPHLRRLRHNIK